MGILKLNELTKNAATYSIKPNTVIIDGNNLVINYLTSIYSSLMKTYPNAEWKCVDMPVLKQLYYIYTDTTNSITKTLNIIKMRMTINEHNVIVVFDPINPTYMINGQTMNLKELEQQKRKTTQSKEAIMKSIINQLTLQGRESEIQEFKEHFHFAELSNLLKLIPLIIKSVVNNVDGVLFVQAQSEADLVIANLAGVFSYSTVLIMSMDTDYLVLVSDIPNVYKTDIKLKQPIFYPYQLWRDVFGENINFDDISFIATLSGNDYTAHASIMSFNVKDYKNFIDGDYQALSRKHKIKNFQTPDDLNDVFKISYDLYHCITQNFDCFEYERTVILGGSTISTTSTDETEELDPDLIEFAKKFDNTLDENLNIITDSKSYLNNLLLTSEFEL